MRIAWVLRNKDGHFVNDKLTYSDNLNYARLFSTRKKARENKNETEVVRKVILDIAFV